MKFCKQIACNLFCVVSFKIISFKFEKIFLLISQLLFLSINNQIEERNLRNKIGL